MKLENKPVMLITADGLQAVMTIEVETYTVKEADIIILNYPGVIARKYTKDNRQLERNYKLDKVHEGQAFYFET